MPAFAPKPINITNTAARDTDAEELWPEGVSLEEMVRSQQKKKTEAAAQKPAEETSDVTEDDKNSMKKDIINS